MSNKSYYEFTNTAIDGDFEVHLKDQDSMDVDDENVVVGSDSSQSQCLNSQPVKEEGSELPGVVGDQSLQSSGKAVADASSSEPVEVVESEMTLRTELTLKAQSQMVTSQVPTRWTLNAFNELPFMITGNAFNQLEANLKLPIEQVFLSGTAVMSTMLQDLIDVEHPLNGSPMPVCTMSCQVIGSGGGKSLITDEMYKRIKAFQLKIDSDYEIAIDEYEIEKSIYDEEGKVLAKEFREAMKEGFSDTEKAALIAHKRKKLIPPRRLQFIKEDSTSASLLEFLAEQHSSVTLATSEGGTLAKSQILKDFALLNKLNGAETVVSDRVSRKNYTINNGRLTLDWMIQDGVLSRFIGSRGDAVKDSGFSARLLVFAQGVMPAKSIESTDVMPSGDIDLFHQRIDELLTMNYEKFNKNNKERILLRLSPEAKAEYKSFFNWVQAQMLPGGIFYNAKGYAAKLPDKAVRVAALFHGLEGYEGDISAKTLKTIITLLETFSDHYMRVFVPPPQAIIDAGNLNDWFNKIFRVKNHRYIRTSQIQRYGPSSLRSKRVLFDALGSLADQGLIQVYQNGRAFIVDLYPGQPMNDPALQLVQF